MSTSRTSKTKAPSKSTGKTPSFPPKKDDKKTSDSKSDARDTTKKTATTKTGFYAARGGSASVGGGERNADSTERTAEENFELSGKGYAGGPGRSGRISHAAAADALALEKEGEYTIASVLRQPLRG
tara:strand:+ start:163 stop:543 length:381 start_codon:yes stop_codon:yes gene_type:complete